MDSSIIINLYKTHTGQKRRKVEEVMHNRAIMATVTVHCMQEYNGWETTEHILKWKPRLKR